MSDVVERLSNTDDNRAYFTFDGDLCQMSAMERALREAGFNVVRNNVYPGFRETDKEEYVRALKFIFTNRIDGWWNQERVFIEHGICTQEEFNHTLGRKVN